MTILRRFRIAICVGLMGTAATRAHDPKPQPPGQPVKKPAVEAAGDAAAAVDSFHAALVAGDREGVLRSLDRQVVIFESGGAEMSRDEYALHHLEADMEFVRAVKTEVVDRQAHATAEIAWVLTRTRTRGRFRERDLDIDGTETMVLRRFVQDWRIVHVHWSSSAR